MGRLHGRAAFAGLLLPLGLCACSSISASIGSVSNSVEAAFGSVSDSFKSLSGGGGSSSASLYRADVREYTLASLSASDRDDAGKQGGEKLDFMRELGRIAELHGITDWEGDANTSAAIREAVESGAVDAVAIERLRAELAPLGAEWVDAAVGVAR
jgi:hypothetical protein